MKCFVCIFALATSLLGACGDDGGNAGIDGNILRPDGDNDIDLDGIKDDVDNCPAATNAFQGNEDNDKFGDACDPCPTVADDNPPDADLDQVADACDPKPSMPGDKIAFFEGFHQGVPQGWDKVGTWTTANDQLTGTATAAGHFALIVTNRTRETVTARVTFSAMTSSASFAGLVDNRAQNGTTGINCVQAMDAVRVFETSNPSDQASMSAIPTIPSTHIVKLVRENQSYTCDVASSGMATRAYTLVNTPYLTGFVIAAATIRVDWFMVVESL